MTDAATLKERFAAVKALRRQDELNAGRFMSEIHRINEEIAVRENSILLCQRCLDEQADGKRFLENLNTALLKAVFDPGHSFEMETVVKEGRVTGLKRRIVEEGAVRRQGGGAQNLASLGNRMAFLAFLSKRLNLTPFIFFDEQLNNLDVERWPRLIQFLMDAEGVVPQMAFITHQDVDFPTTATFRKTGMSTSVVTQEGETL